MHSLDHVVSERLRAPNAWELAQYSQARGPDRQDWSRILDEAPGFVHDEAVLRVVEQDARRLDAKLWCMPAPAVCAGAPRASVFRSLFLKNIGGVSGASDIWVDADNVLADGVSGKLASWVDYVDPAHLFSQATAASQVPMPAADASLTGAKSATWTTAAEQYGGNRARSLYQFCHDMSGLNSFVGTLPTANSAANGYLATIQAATGPGIQFYRISNVNSCNVFNAAGNMGGTSTGAFPVGAVTYAEVQLTGSSFLHFLRSTPTGAGSLTGLPATGIDSTGTLTLGGSPGSAVNGWQGRIPFAYIFRRVLSAAQRTVVRSQIQAKYGIAP